MTPIREFGIGDVEGAMRSLQSGQEGGKVVISMGGVQEVKMLIPRSPGWSLKPNRTYVICGGLGGLGRSAARWNGQQGCEMVDTDSREAGPERDNAKKDTLA